MYLLLMLVYTLMLWSRSRLTFLTFIPLADFAVVFHAVSVYLYSIQLKIFTDPKKVHLNYTYI